jgi:hypothetical protein
MTSLDLTEIVEHRMSDPNVLGRVICLLHHNQPVEQRHHDDFAFTVDWHDFGDFWRCTIASNATPAQTLAQIDLQENATVRVDAFAPCRVTISPDEGFLCLTRYK